MRLRQCVEVEWHAGKAGIRAPPTLHSRSIPETMRDYASQQEEKCEVQKTFSEQYLAWPVVVWYGLGQWCRGEDLNLHAEAECVGTLPEWEPFTRVACTVRQRKAR